MPVCCACNCDLPRSHFTSNQLRKRSDERRCCTCVDNGIFAQNDDDDEDDQWFDDDEEEEEESTDDDEDNWRLHCSACGKTQHASLFSFNQSRKPAATRRCAACIEGGVQTGSYIEVERERQRQEQLARSRQQLLEREQQQQQQQQQRQQQRTSDGAATATTGGTAAAAATSSSTAATAAAASSSSPPAVRTKLERDEFSCIVCLELMSADPTSPTQAKMMQGGCTHLCCRTCIDGLVNSTHSTSGGLEAFQRRHGGGGGGSNNNGNDNNSNSRRVVAFNCPHCRAPAYGAIDLPGPVRALVEFVTHKEWRGGVEQSDVVEKSIKALGSESQNLINEFYNEHVDTLQAHEHHSCRGCEGMRQARAFYKQAVAVNKSVEMELDRSVKAAARLKSEIEVREAELAKMRQDLKAAGDAENECKSLKLILSDVIGPCSKHFDRKRKDLPRTDAEGNPTFLGRQTAIVNNVNIERRCGGVDLPGREGSVLFLESNVHLLSRLHRGARVRCTVEMNPRHPGSLVAKSLRLITGDDDDSSSDSGDGSDGDSEYDYEDMIGEEHARMMLQDLLAAGGFDGGAELMMAMFGDVIRGVSRGGFVGGGGGGRRGGGGGRGGRGGGRGNRR